MTTLVKPFAALRPHADHAAAVAAPPYDVVSTAEARRLVTGRPNSFLHISRPEIDLPDGVDPHSDRVYAKARENLDRLISLGLLIRDPGPSYYAYRMRMEAHEQTGVALVASVAAYENNSVRKHELTQPDKETDRVRNMASLNAQTGPVLSAYRASSRLKELLDEAKNAEPIIDIVGPNQVAHTLWRVGDPAVMQSITRAFDDMQTLYIADGHHRSAAAARVAAERRTHDHAASDPSCEYFLSVAFPHDEMRIFDYNRFVGELHGSSAAEILAALEGKFELQELERAYKPDKPASFGMYLAGRWYRLTLRHEHIPQDDPVARLDVSLLQAHVMAPVLGIDDQRTDKRVEFIGGIRGLGELEKRVDEAASGVAFSFFPTSMEQLMAVADAGKLMPPKSTWFEPKLADGLLTHVLD